MDHYHIVTCCLFACVIISRHLIIYQVDGRNNCNQHQVPSTVYNKETRIEEYPYYRHNVWLDKRYFLGFMRVFLWPVFGYGHLSRNIKYDTDQLTAQCRSLFHRRTLQSRETELRKTVPSSYDCTLLRIMKHSSKVIFIETLHVCWSMTGMMEIVVCC